MNVSFTVKNTSGHDIEDLGVAFDITGGEIWDEDEDDREYGYAFPFEVTGALNDTDKPKNVGRLNDGKEKKVTLSARVRRDLSNGYYNVPVVVMEKTDNGWLWIGSEDIRAVSYTHLDVYKRQSEGRTAPGRRHACKKRDRFQRGTQGEKRRNPEGKRGNPPDQ